MLIERLCSRHNRAEFACGEETLDRYFRQQAGQDAGRNLGVTYVAVESGQSGDVLGYYTLATGCVQPENVPEKHIPPRRAVPVILLGRLAVAKSAQGRRIGETLLMDALRRCEELSQRAGMFAVVVDALHDRARDFYLRYGFAELGDSPLHLYMTIKDIRKLNL